MKVLIFLTVALAAYFASAAQTEDEENEIVHDMLHNWQTVREDVADFEAWVCNHWSATQAIAKHFVEQNPEDRQLGQWGLSYITCTFNENRSTLNKFIREKYPEILKKQTSKDPDYTIWNLFEEFAAHKNETVHVYQRMTTDETDDYIVWTRLNIGLLVDRLEAFASSRSDLEDMPGFRW